jgi:hypothetical protein
MRIWTIDCEFVKVDDDITGRVVCSSKKLRAAKAGQFVFWESRR